jgi:type VI secretion system protein
MTIPTPLLTLRISRADAAPSALGLARVFDGCGGTIGRAPGNDWILPDPSRVLSAHHATIYFEQGRYRIVDCSTNGVFLNDDDAPLGASRVAALHDGDRLGLGDYQIDVSVAAPAPAPAAAIATASAPSPASVDPLRVLAAGAAASAAMSIERKPPVPSSVWFEAPRAPVGLPATPSAVVDPLLLLGEAGAPGSRRDGAPSAPSAPSATRDDAPALAAFFRPPAAAAPVPEDWFATGIVLAAAPPAPTPKPAPAPAQVCVGPSIDRATPPASAAHSPDRHRDSLEPAVDRLLRAAGLDPTRIPRRDPAATLAAAGTLLREATNVVRELLLVQARSRIDLGLPAKVMQAQGNNPLEFCPRGVEQAIDMLLFDDGPACLGPTEALRTALDDLKAGREQELGSLRARASRVLERLAPAAIERSCETPSPLWRRAGSGAPPASCWSLYKQRHAEAREALDPRPPGARAPAHASRTFDDGEAAHGLA